MSATTRLLVASGVTKRFGPVEAHVDVDFDVDAGEVMALVGDNGAGKSAPNVCHVADRISVLRRGRNVATFDRSTTSRDDVVAAITGARAPLAMEVAA